MDDYRLDKLTPSTGGTDASGSDTFDTLLQDGTVDQFSALIAKSGYQNSADHIEAAAKSAFHFETFGEKLEREVSDWRTKTGMNARLDMPYVVGPVMTAGANMAKGFAGGVGAVGSGVRALAEDYLDKKSPAYDPVRGFGAWVQEKMAYTAAAVDPNSIQEYRDVHSVRDFGEWLGGHIESGVGFMGPMALAASSPVGWAGGVSVGVTQGIGQARDALEASGIEGDNLKRYTLGAGLVLGAVNSALGSQALGALSDAAKLKLSEYVGKRMAVSAAAGSFAGDAAKVLGKEGLKGASLMAFQDAFTLAAVAAANGEQGEAAIDRALAAVSDPRNLAHIAESGVVGMAFGVSMGAPRAAGHALAAREYRKLNETTRELADAGKTAKADIIEAAKGEQVKPREDEPAQELPGQPDAGKGRWREADDGRLVWETEDAAKAKEEQARIAEQKAAAEKAKAEEPLKARSSEKVAVKQEAEFTGDGVADGEPMQIVTPDNSMEVTARPEIIDLRALKRASGELQPRDRSRAESKAVSLDRAAHFDPEQHRPNRVADSGAPIVDVNGVILSGNGRHESLTEIYSNPALAHKAAELRASLGDAANGIEQPIRVMRLAPGMSEAEKATFADLANRQRIQTLSPTEQARRDAAAAGPDLMGLYKGGEFTAPDNREFLRQFAGKVMTANELSELSRNGELSKSGRDRLNAAVLAAAYDHPEALALALESTDSNVENIAKAMRDSAGGMARLRSAIINGDVPAEYDISQNIADALLTVNRLRENGVKVADHLAQIDAFNPIDPVTERLLRAFHTEDMTRGASQKAIREFLSAYADEALQKRSGGLFEDTTTPGDVIDMARGKTPDASIMREGRLGQRDRALMDDLFKALQETAPERAAQFVERFAAELAGPEPQTGPGALSPMPIDEPYHVATAQAIRQGVLDAIDADLSLSNAGKARARRDVVQAASEFEADPYGKTMGALVDDLRRVVGYELAASGSARAGYDFPVELITGIKSGPHRAPSQKPGDAEFLDYLETAARTGTLATNVTVYHGLTQGELSLAQLKTGAVIDAPGLIKASPAPGAGSGVVHLRVTLPKGEAGFVVDKGRGGVILPAGTALRIKGIAKQAWRVNPFGDAGRGKGKTQSGLIADAELVMSAEAKAAREAHAEGIRLVSERKAAETAAAEAEKRERVAGRVAEVEAAKTATAKPDSRKAFYDVLESKARLDGEALARKLGVSVKELKALVADAVEAGWLIETDKGKFRRVAAGKRPARPDVSEAPAVKVAAPAPKAEAPASAPRSLLEVLKSPHVRKDWARVLGVSEAQLQPMIDDAVAKGWLRRDKRGVVRRNPAGWAEVAQPKAKAAPTVEKPKAEEPKAPTLPGKAGEHLEAIRNSRGADRAKLVAALERDKTIKPADMAAIAEALTGHTPGKGRRLALALIDSWRPASAPKAETVDLRTRIYRAAYEAAGNRWDGRVLLRDLRNLLPDVPRATLDAELRQMMHDKKAVLFHYDNHAELTRPDLIESRKTQGIKEAGIPIFPNETFPNTWEILWIPARDVPHGVLGRAEAQAPKAKPAEAYKAPEIKSLQELEALADKWFNREDSYDAARDPAKAVQLLAEATADWKVAERWIGKNEGTDIPGQPEKGRPHSGVIHARLSDIRGAIDTYSQRKAWAEKYEAAQRGETTAPTAPAGGVHASAIAAGGVDAMATGLDAAALSTKSFPDAPTRQARAGTEAPATSLREVMTDFRDALGLTVRFGRLNQQLSAAARSAGARLHGQSDSNTGVIRLADQRDYDTTAHEAGHQLHDRYRAEIDGMVAAHQNELQNAAAAHALGPASHREQFAEWFRRYMTNPVAAERMAPNFFEQFEELIDARAPETLAELQRLQTSYQSWLTQSSSATVRSQIVYHQTQGWWSRFRANAEQTSFARAMSWQIDKLYTFALDELHPLKVARDILIDHATHNLGREVTLKAANDFYKLFRMVKGAYAQGHADIMEGVRGYRQTDPNGPSLKAALETAMGGTGRGQWSQDMVEKFDGYLASRRMIQEYARFARGELDRAPGPDALAEYQQSVVSLEAENPQFSRAAQQVYDFLAALLRKQRDAGFIKDDVYRELIKKRDYVPLMRHMQDFGDYAQTFADGRTTAGGRNERGLLRAFRGSDRDILSPIQSIAQRAYDTSYAIARNDAFRALDRLSAASGPGGGAIAERIPSVFGGPDNPKDNIVYFWEGGVRRSLKLADGELGDMMINAVTSLGGRATDLWVELASLPARAVRTGVTISPDFIVSNFVRDQIATWVNTEGYTPFVSGARGAVGNLTLNQWARRYGSFGGISGGAITDELQMRIDRDIQRLRTHGTITVRSALNPFQAYRKILETSESSTRIGLFEASYRRALRDGMTEYEALVEASYVSRDVLDFDRHGSGMDIPRKLIPFFNAGLQGIDRYVRALRGSEDRLTGLRDIASPFANGANWAQAQFAPATLSVGQREAMPLSRQAWLKSIVPLGMISAALSALYADDPEFDEIGETIRTTHWVFKAGTDSNGKSVWVRIPKPFEVAWFADIVERGYDCAYKGDKAAAGKALRSVLDLSLPAMNAPALFLPIELAFNHNMHFGGSIVKDEGLPVDMQYDAHTSQLAKKIGAAVGVAPAYVDHVVTSLGGSGGRELLNASNRLAGPVAPGTVDSPFARRFLTDPNKGSDTSAKFWELMGQQGGRYTMAAKGYKQALEKDRDPVAAQARLDKLPDDERVYAVMFEHGGPDDKQLHPLYRAQTVCTAAGSIMKEINARGAVDLKAHVKKNQEPERVPLSREDARRVIDVLRDYQIREYSNALKLLGAPGWEQRPVRETDGLMDELKAISPKVAKEFADKLSDKRGREKVYDFDEVAALWPRVRADVLANGVSADLKHYRP